MRAGIGRPDSGNERVLSLLLAIPDFEMLVGAIAGALGPIANRRYLHAFFHGTPPTRVIAVVHIRISGPRGSSSILPQSSCLARTRPDIRFSYPPRARTSLLPF